VAMALMALLPGTAAANHSQQTIFDATGDILRADSTAARNGILDQIESFGVDTVRVVIPWRDIVPSPQAAVRPAGFDPTNPDDYVGDIGAIDDVVKGATARGMQVLLTPSSPIPNWASRSGASYISDPKPDEFEALLEGLGSRYSGTHVPCVPIEPPPATPPTCTPTPPALPRVHMWSLYNEPNLNLYLQPQYRNGKPVAGTIYRSLFLAGQQGLAASGHGGDTVLIGETSPGPGTHSTAPITFLRQVLCLDTRYHRRPGCAPISASGWAHHPYDLRGSPIKVSSRKLVTIATMSRLTDALTRAAKAHATSRRLPVYVTEYGVETIPDPMGGVSFVKQAAYLALAEMLLWNNPQVRSYAQYLLTDDPGNGQFSFQSGLRRANGFRKASYDSFPISLVVRRLGRKLEFWGHVRPASGPVRVRIRQRDSAGPPFLLRTMRTDGGGYFKFTEPLHDGRRWSAQATLPNGTLLEGPYIPAFGF
jgi:hypothetical protein